MLPATRTLKSIPAVERLWPSFLELKQNLLTNHMDSLPESISNTLTSMDDDKIQSTYNDDENLHRIGAMTQSVNTFLQKQMTEKTSEAVYTPATLDAYDAMVWDFNSPFHWRIHRHDIDLLYEEGLRGSQRHCEVAVGTGLFLRSWAARNLNNQEDYYALKHLTLMDLSPSALEGCYQRLQDTDGFDNQVTMEKLQANILNPPPENVRGVFHSVAANFLLHCLHGDSLEDKRAAIESCAALLQPEGVFFGSTILGKDLEADAAMAGPHAIATNQFYNEIGIFGNQGDAFVDMATILEEIFHHVTIVKVGYCAVWLARKPKVAT